MKRMNRYARRKRQRRMKMLTVAFAIAIVALLPFGIFQLGLGAFSPSSSVSTAGIMPEEPVAQVLSLSATPEQSSAESETPPTEEPVRATKSPTPTPETKEATESAPNVVAEDQKSPTDIPSPKIDPNQKMIALTFDDGPHPKVTERILNVLEENNARATFFILGNRVKGNESTLKRAHKMGCQIASHTYSHKNLTEISVEKIKTQENKTSALIKKTIGVPARLLRPPYGAYNKTVRKNVSVPLVLWSIDTLDWKSKNASKVTKKVLGKVQDGDIILMHDIYETTADAVETIVPKLIKEGYQLVTVEELYALRGKEMKPGKAYANNRPSK